MAALVALAPIVLVAIADHWFTLWEWVGGILCFGAGWGLRNTIATQQREQEKAMREFFEERAKRHPDI